MKITVLYQDDFLLICEKPVGILSESPGLPDLVYAQTGINPFPVHRLDQGTGGVCILACTAEICAHMQKFFHQGLVRKEYLAVISGKPLEASGIYEDLLFHDRKHNKTYVVNRKRAGVKKAVCEWQLVKTVSYENQLLSLVRIFLHTGRTHQIRVQFGSRGFPLAGDRKYGIRIKADAPALWAGSVCFPHPVFNDQMVRISATPDQVFPWSLFPEEL